MNNEDLSKQLARRIFACGDDGPKLKAVRLQYKTGSLTAERDGGGFIEPSFAVFLESLLDELTPAQRSR